MKYNQVILRCEDRQEAAVFTKYTYKTIMKITDGQVKLDDGYEIQIEDSYIGGDYRGFFGRVKRAWKAFRARPVVYTGIYCDDKIRMKKFLENCLAIVDDEEIKYDNEPFVKGLYAEDDK